MTTTHKVIAGIGVVWLVILSVLGFRPHSSVTQTGGATTLGSQVYQEPIWFVNGAQYGNFGTNMNFINLTLGPGQNQVAWQNTTGVTVYTSSDAYRFMLVATSTGATPLASTTQFLYVGTSTAATVKDLFTGSAPVYGSILDKVVIATSSQNFVHDGVSNSTFSGSNEQGLIAVPNGQYLVSVIEDGWSTQCSGSVCETATSTNRGFNGSITFPIWTQ